MEPEPSKTTTSPDNASFRLRKETSCASIENSADTISGTQSVSSSRSYDVEAVREQVVPSKRPSSSNPFALRLGKKLVWKDVSLKIRGKRRKEADQTILEDVWGEVREKETTAIMGPSGAVSQIVG